jgi:hypothetical protein
MFARRGLGLGSGQGLGYTFQDESHSLHIMRHSACRPPPPRVADAPPLFVASSEITQLPSRPFSIHFSGGAMGAWQGVANGLSKISPVPYFSTPYRWATPETALRGPYRGLTGALLGRSLQIR